MKRLTILLSSLLLFSVSRDAAAQGFINPFVGTTLTSPSAKGGHSKAGFGVAFGAIGKVVGGETEIAFYPEVIDTTANALDKSRVITFSGNALIGPTIGAVKPYFALGAGNLNLNVKSLASVVLPNPTNFTSNYFTFNVGGGVMGFFGNHFGVRGDLRYHRAFGFNITDLTTTSGAGLGGLTLDRFDFWRAAFGLVVKF